MTFRIKTKAIGDVPFFLSYGLFLVTSILSTSFFYRFYMGKPFMWLQILCVALLIGYEILSNGVEEQNWIGLAAAMVLSSIAMRISDGNLQRLVAVMFLYTYCARRIPFAKVAGFTLNVSIVMVCVIVCCSYLGIIDNVTVSKSGRVREYLGFRYALYLPGILLNMTALWIYLRKERITVPGALVWAVANWVVYIKTDSRISFVLAELLLVAALAIRYLPKVVEKIKVFWAVLAASFGVCTVFSLFMTIIYDSTIPWMRKLNSMLESRLSLGKRSLEDFGVNWFGKRIDWIGNGLDAQGNTIQEAYNYVDCLYVKILQRYGMAFFLILLVLLCWSMYRLFKRREYHLLLICASVAAHCILDDLSFALHYNTFWIAMGVALLCPAMLDWDGKTNQISPPEIQKE